MRKTKAEKGITLVALIITIIVLLILAVVAISAVQNDGIIEYAKNARTEYEKAQGNEQSTLDYYLSQIETTKGIHNGTILKGGSYTRGEESFEEGDKFPASPVNGDVYVYEDYQYTYYDSYSEITPNVSWEDDNNMKGWRVQVLETGKEKYGEILTTINGADVKSVATTFRKCSSLNKAPSIPSTVVDMRGTFGYCSSLKSMPIIPYGVKNMLQTFYGCTSLYNISAIPSTVINMTGTFQNCTLLTSAPTIPEGVENMWGTFGQCINLKTPPSIPNSVTNMHSTFEGCLALQSAPEIPSSVTNMNATFWGCKSLIGDVIIKTTKEKLDITNKENYDNCFYVLNYEGTTTNEIYLVGINENNDNVYDNIDVLNALAETDEGNVKSNVTVKPIS